jgi:mono/diheme cytochrome c family protein
MKVFGRTTVLWIALTAVSAAIALGQQQSKFPEGPGRAILERACGSCHAADTITTHHFATPGEYKDIIDAMIGSGAQVSDTEKPILVDYLFTNWGTKPAPGAAPPPDPGKAILEAACTSCHGLDTLANHVYAEKGPYQSLVDNMIAYGAPVTAAQKPVLVDYMLKTYGKK